jgi:hypothetical protein
MKFEATLHLLDPLLQLRSRNVEPALTWATARREVLVPGQASTHDLEFKLHKLKFVSLLQKARAE